MHTKEKIARLGAHTAHAEELHKIMKLSMNISADRHRRIDTLHIALFH